MPSKQDRRLLAKLMCTASPAHLAAHASGGAWFPYKHLLVVLEALMRVVRGQCKRLQISLPPQHGKSELVSCWFLAWLLMVRPDTRAMLASYEAENAEQWGRRVRDVVEEFGGLFGVQVDPRSAAAHRWAIKGRRGRMVTAGVGGPLTGKAADIAVIDDPIKDADQAASARYRERQKEWFIKVLERRLSKHGAIILVMTRWNEDDLSGWLHTLEKEGKGEPWDRVVLPALAPHREDLSDEAAEYFGKDPLDRAPGEALCPELHDAKEFENWRQKDEGAFWALGQQFPFTPKGGMFKADWWRYWDVDKNPLEWNGTCFQYKPGVSQFEVIGLSFDFQFGSQAKTTKSWTVGQVWGVMGGQYWLLYQLRDKMEFVDMIACLKKLVLMFPMAGPKLIEAKAAGPYIGKLMRVKIPGIILLDTQGDKVARASGVTYLYEATSVLLPPVAQYPWVRDYRNEFVAFPKGTDDQVDASSQFLAWHTVKPQMQTRKEKPEFFDD